MNKKMNLVGIAAVTLSVVFSSVAANAADISALTNSGSNGYVESTSRKVATYLQNEDSSNEQQVSVSEEEIDFEIAYVSCDDHYLGEEEVVQEGVKGLKKVTTTTKVVDGKPVDVVISEEVVKEPVNQIVEVGTKEKPVDTEVATDFKSESGFSYKKVLTIDATAYCPCSKCCGKWANGVTATGLKAGYGVAAVDPKVIPLGTKLYVEGYGYCIAADTGGAIKGNRIDLCYNSHSAALASGYGHTATKVYILS